MTAERMYLACAPVDGWRTTDGFPFLSESKRATPLFDWHQPFAIHIYLSIGVQTCHSLITLPVISPSGRIFSSFLFFLFCFLESDDPSTAVDNQRQLFISHHRPLQGTDVLMYTTDRSCTQRPSLHDDVEQSYQDGWPKGQSLTCPSTENRMFFTYFCCFLFNKSDECQSTI